MDNNPNNNLVKMNSMTAGKKKKKTEDENLQELEESKNSKQSISPPPPGKSQYPDSHDAEGALLNLIASLPSSEKYQLELNAVIIPSSISASCKDDPTKIQEAIVKEFNAGASSIVTTSGLFGKRIEPDQFRVVALNKVAQLVPPTKHPIRKKLYPLPGDVRQLTKQNLEDPFIPERF